MKSGIAIQFVNYKTESYLKDAVAGVSRDMKDSGIEHEIFVIDNASGDTLSSLENATILRSNRNFGFGAGHNRLAALHDYSHILILNPDIRIIEERTVRRLFSSMLESGAAVIGGRLVGKDRNQQAWDHGELDTSRSADSPTSDYRERTDKGEVAWVSGADSLIDASAFHQIGGFDEKFFLYKDEEDLCLRLRQNGHATFYDPSISILHYGSVVASKDSPHFGESIAYYNKKHHLD